MKALGISLFFSILVCSLSAQTTYPQDYFRSPLDIPLNLSGNFGELRTNHFHTGIDIKTEQREGLKIYAAAEGYVSRIKVSPVGYGYA
jgi:murein DD-endopeptidase MepM/ murein hydrolase activator NlpD